jgi:diguanylate cyclase (GGDEF)-like protein
VAVLYCDLKGLKDVNDRHGHAAGDVILRTTADRLRRMIRAHGTASRLGGDEFCVVLRHVLAGWDAQTMLNRIADHLAQPVPIHEHVLTPSASIGVVLADPSSRPDTDRNADELLTAADHARYRHSPTHRSRPGPPDRRSPE